MTSRDEEIERYATAVRTALADIPEADRTELLEDLEDHLAEVSAESAEPLRQRLGTPESYAAELRAAYGAGAGKRRSWRAAAGRRLHDLHRVIGEHRYAAARDDLARLQPAWWMVRGYLVAVLLWSLSDGDHFHLLPANPIELATALVLTVGSAILGMRARNPRTRRLLGAASVLAALIPLYLIAVGPTGPVLAEVPPDTAWEGPPPSPAFGEITNIYPYSKDGKPLRDVLLYDQEGRPITVPYENFGYLLDRPCGSQPPLANSYPLPLVPNDTEPTLCPHTFASPTPSEAPSPTPSG